MVISNLMKLVVPIGLFVWSLFQPITASYVFVVITAIFVAYLFFIDIICKPKPNPLIWNPDEFETLKKYHLGIRYPFGAKILSCCLNGIRWSSLIWVPWLLWNHLWIPAGFLSLNFFLTASISVRLDPFFFLSEAVNRGQYQFTEELAILQDIQKKFNEDIKSDQRAASF